jgi:hypothetical protein
MTAHPKMHLLPLSSRKAIFWQRAFSDPTDLPAPAAFGMIGMSFGRVYLRLYASNHASVHVVKCVGGAGRDVEHFRSAVLAALLQEKHKLKFYPTRPA